MAWVTVVDVEAWLGLAPATDGDTTHLTRATAAANEKAFKMRHAAGHVDDPDVSPGADVELGTIQMAGVFYKQRGSIDNTLAAFDQFGQTPPTGATWREIERLLGCRRPHAR